MRLNEYGAIVEKEWARSSEIRKEIEMDAFIVMPNHVHGIVMIKWHPPVGANGRSPLQMTPKSISSFMSGFKSSVTKIINEQRNTPALPVWQRNYYEHVIRNEEDLNRIRKYIVENPLKWGDDEDNPTNIIDRDRRGERPFAPTMHHDQ
jgi:putative transposase